MRHHDPQRQQEQQIQQDRHDLWADNQDGARTNRRRRRAAPSSPGGGGGRQKVFGRTSAGWDLLTTPRRQYGAGRLHPKLVVGFIIFAGAVLIVVHVFLLSSVVFPPSDGGNAGPAASAASQTGIRGGRGSDSSGADAGGGTTAETTVFDPSDFEAQLAEAKSRRLTPLGPADRERYTIRINTWRRNEQLLVSLNHHSQCEGVAQIQVVWCDSENEPPDEVVNHPSGKVVVERHEVNSLNERFHAPNGTPTLGVLSMDDDVLRPCLAIDSGFFRWTAHPDRIVGYDARLHVPNPETDRFEYGYLSATERYNRYSMTLPRYCFVHRDYLDLYMTHLPRPIFDRVADKFNCEDIAMSFFVSALTDGRPPLLADFWAAKTQIKLYSPAGTTISGGAGHKIIRDECVNDFLLMLGLSVRGDDGRVHASIGFHELWHKDHVMFGQGAESDKDPFAIAHNGEDDYDNIVPRHKKLAAEVGTWANLPDREIREGIVGDMIKDARGEAVDRGLVEKTLQWEKRWKKKKQEHQRTDR